MSALRVGRSDGGAATVELVLLTPLLVMLLLIVVGLGRLASTRLSVSDAAYQAARAASLARGDAEAKQAAQAAVSAALSASGSSCATRRIEVSTGGLRPGGVVQVTLACTADLGDLTLSHLPGAVTLHQQAVSPIDARREAP